MMAGTVWWHNVVFYQKKSTPTHLFYFIKNQKRIQNYATFEEENNLNNQEIKCFNISQIISITNCQTFNFDYVHFTQKWLHNSMVLGSRIVGQCIPYNETFAGQYIPCHKKNLLSLSYWCNSVTTIKIYKTRT